MMTIDAQETARLRASWATAAHQLSRVLALQGSLFDASLKKARAVTYERAAALLRASPDREKAARSMIRKAVEAHVRTPPLVGYDDAALRYTVARTWQRCALMLDPSLTEVQPLWTERTS
jgi:hypothetical protein